jgi:hypothetical protein
MHDILPEGEDLRRAVKWISANLQDGADKKIHKLVEEAIFKFDLSPKDADFLMNFFSQRKEEK